jgi:hypothetical protein
MRKEIQKLGLEVFFSLLRDVEWTNEPRCELASYLEMS